MDNRSPNAAMHYPLERRAAVAETVGHLLAFPQTERHFDRRRKGNGVPVHGEGSWLHPDLRSMTEKTLDVAGSSGGWVPYTYTLSPSLYQHALFGVPIFTSSISGNLKFRSPP